MYSWAFSHREIETSGHTEICTWTFIDALFLQDRERPRIDLRIREQVVNRDTAHLCHLQTLSSRISQSRICFVKVGVCFCRCCFLLIFTTFFFLVVYLCFCLVGSIISIILCVVNISLEFLFGKQTPCKRDTFHFLSFNLKYLLSPQNKQGDVVNLTRNYN